jgi:hypothetical protein
VQLLQDRLRSRGGPNQRASLGASSKRLTARAGPGGGSGGAAAASSSSRVGAGGAGLRSGRAGAGAAGVGGLSGSHLPSPEIYFPGNQEFFYHFLRASDSYALNLALARVLGAELARTALSTSPTSKPGRQRRHGQEHEQQRRPSPPSEAEEDGDGSSDAQGMTGQQVTDPTHLARLKLLARFLGLLVFSPNWSNALPQLTLLE